jgi:hypothetical protein
MPDFELTPRATADRAWIVEQIGRRYRGIQKTGEAAFEVTLAKPDKKLVWVFGQSAEAAMAKARKRVESMTDVTNGEQP